MKKSNEEFFNKQRFLLDKIIDKWDYTHEEHKKNMNYENIRNRFELSVAIKNLKTEAYSYGTEIDTFIFDLDIEARKIYKKDKDYSFVSELVDLIKKAFNTYDELELKFLNDEFQYEIPYEIFEIKTYWEEELNNNPTVLEMIAKENEKLDKRFDLLYKELEGIKKQFTKELPKAEELYSSQCKEIDEELDKEIKEIEKVFKDKTDKIINKLSDDNNKENKELKKKIDELKERNIEIEKELSSLSILQILKKKDLNNELEENNNTITKYTNKIVRNDSNYKRTYNHLLENTEDDIQDKIEEIKQTYRYPMEPEKVVNIVTSIMSFYQNIPGKCVQDLEDLENHRYEKLKTIVKLMIENGKPIRLYDAIRNNKETYWLFRLLGYQDLDVAIDTLEFRKIIRQTNKKGCYHELVDKKNFVIDVLYDLDYLIDKDKTNTFSKNRTKVLKELSKTKEINPLVCDSFKNMNSIQLFQVLISLEIDGLVIKQVDENKIIYIKK